MTPQEVVPIALLCMPAMVKAFAGAGRGSSSSSVVRAAEFLASEMSLSVPEGAILMPRLLVEKVRRMPGLPAAKAGIYRNGNWNYVGRIWKGPVASFAEILVRCDRMMPPRAG